MDFIGRLLINIIDIYTWIIIFTIALSWLIAFEVLNVRNAQAANLVRLCDRLTEPVYRPLRKFVPPLGGIDVTPIVIIFGLHVLKQIVANIFFG